MGFEYKIEFEYDSETELDQLLRRLDGFDGVETQFGGYRFCADGPREGMPDVEVRIQAAGLYACVYGGEGSRLFRDLIGELLAEHDRVTVAKLDWE